MWADNLVKAIVWLWNSILLNVYEILTQTTYEWGGGGPWTIAESINNALVGIGTGIALVFWAVSFFKYVEDFHKIDMREAAGWILRFAVVVVVIQETMLIMKAFLELGMTVNNTIMGMDALNIPVLNGSAGEITADDVMGQPGFIGLPDDLLAKMEEIATTGSVLEQIGAFFMEIPIGLFFIILLVAIFFAGITIVITLFLRFFKLYIYTALAPIPLSTLAGSTSGEVGKHFLKAWASVCFEICVITIAVAIFAASMSDSSDILHVFGTGESGADLADEWALSINWGIQVLIKSLLLVSVIKGSDRIMEKIIGT